MTARKSRPTARSQSRTSDERLPAAEPPAPGDLVLTGERTLPGIPDERYWFARHLVVYEWAAEMVLGLAASRPRLAVLDAGCGEGYGLPLLADAGADRIVGADLDPVVTAHATATYARRDRRIEVVTAELMDLPLGDDEIDCTVSFQVIEHLYDIPGYLASLRRVTRPGGSILISTPNRLTFTPASDVPVNPFHTREFTAEELAHELEHAGLTVDDLRGIDHGPRLATFASSRGASLAELLQTGNWDDELRHLVHATSSGDFTVTNEPHTGLDLLARCRVPS